MGNEQWFSDWQSKTHAETYDFRSTLDLTNLVRDYESFNDVLMLKKLFDSNKTSSLVEVGCATGEFYRYLQTIAPGVKYQGVDISVPAIQTASRKYPSAKFFVSEPGHDLSDKLTKAGVRLPVDIVYSKDVIIHQTQPFEFLNGLIEMAEKAVVVRLRTRDKGATVLDPELSCQYHYDGWMPFMMLNTDETIQSIRLVAPKASIKIVKNHIVLGGHQSRFVPKDCFLKETGTAETSILIDLKPSKAGNVEMSVRPDAHPQYTPSYMLKRLSQKAIRYLAARTQK